VFKACLLELLQINHNGYQDCRTAEGAIGQ